MGKVDMSFRYTSAEDSRRPGYLKVKFDRIRRELREKAEREREAQEAAAAEQKRVVRTIKGAK